MKEGFDFRMQVSSDEGVKLRLRLIYLNRIAEKV